MALYFKEEELDRFISLIREEALNQAWVTLQVFPGLAFTSNAFFTRHMLDKLGEMDTLDVEVNT